MNHGQTGGHKHIAGDVNMAEKPIAKKPNIKVNFIPTDGDPLEVVIEAIEPVINSVLAKHGASIKMGVKELLRKHAKV